MASPVRVGTYSRLPLMAGRGEPAHRADRDPFPLPAGGRIQRHQRGTVLVDRVHPAAAEHR